MIAILTVVNSIVYLGDSKRLILDSWQLQVSNETHSDGSKISTTLYNDFDFGWYNVSLPCTVLASLQQQPNASTMHRRLNSKSTCTTFYLYLDYYFINCYALYIILFHFYSRLILCWFIFRISYFWCYFAPN